MTRLPQLNWTSEPLLLVRSPAFGYGVITLEEFQEAGPNAAALTVVGVVGAQYRAEILHYLPTVSVDFATVLLGRRR